MKQLLVDGRTFVFVLEQGWGDGGMVINFLVAEPDGTYLNYRHWFSDPALAKAAYDALDETKAREALSLVSARDADARRRIQERFVARLVTG